MVNNRIKISILLLTAGVFFMVIRKCESWRAIPANQAMYALRSTHVGTNTTEKFVMPDDLLVRDQINHIYKFGWCRPDVISPHFLRKSVNMTLSTWQDTQAEYIYLLESKHTQRYAFQCIIMKTYVNRKYLFFKSRLPLYYCQGQLYLLVFVTVTRFEIHEFYLYHKLSMPANFRFEFYHAPML